MTEQKRITVDEVRDLYKKYDLRPRRGGLQLYAGKCCPLGVIAIDKGCSERAYNILENIYTPSYVRGFYRGFDGASSPHDNSEVGFADGQACQILIEEFYETHHSR